MTYDTETDPENVQAAETDRGDQIDDVPNRPAPIFGTSLLALIAVVFVGVGIQSLVVLTSDRSNHPVVRVVIEGREIWLSENEASGFYDELRKQIEAEHSELISEVEGDIDDRVDKLFQDPIERVPDYVDSYYSVLASMARFKGAVFGGLESHFVKKIDEQLFGGDEFNEELVNTNDAILRKIRSSYNGIGQDIQEELLNKYETESISRTRGNGSWDLPSLDISREIDISVKNVRREELITWANNVATGAAVTGVTFSRLGNKPSLAARTIQNSGRIHKALANRWPKVATAVGRRIPRAAVAGSSATAATAPSGPVSVVSGLVVFGVTLVATEKGALEYERRTSGDEIEEDLRESLVTTRENLKRELIRTYREEISSQKSAMLREIEERANKYKEDERFMILGGST